MNAPLRLAGVDCGTNSIRLLICELSEDGTLKELTRQNTIVRLGQGVDETGRIAPEAIERTRVALVAYVDTMQALGVTRVRMVATSAMRDAANKEDFYGMTRALLGRVELGKHADVISGEEEAALSYAGATADMDPARGPFCVIDLGGGSTEFVVSQRAVSTRMGCVRLTERFMRSDPPTTAETDEARAYVREALNEAAPLFDGVRTFIGCAGTFTTLSALTQRLESYDPARIHMSELLVDDLLATTTTLRAQTTEQRRANPVVHPGRADVIAAGSVVVEEIVALARERAGAHSIVISEKDILDGIVASLT
ncbi:Guanosine-5'-triphosphate,3'-diphosphate pyrophosphatase [Corynebacterium capitovis DSM 44611]|uniref:Ppx/GppA phosphatase family protein n=1 Tax=Corynebacterium capitovis TaxID=131081 RepID=UPI00037AC643|nr:Ppx/GppA phosphatase family protein [Corynebacterium capitovis]WKD57274.1 Guanosine-5'-triphosphate,3'-diphosphate pyrophosphatase [Corynebacterium capitovis DSM 44611]